MDNTQTYIFQTEVIVSGEVMQCVYLLRDECHAQPFVSMKLDFFKPSEDDKKSFCLNPTEFESCPRLHQYLEFLEKSGKINNSKSY